MSDLEMFDKRESSEIGKALTDLDKYFRNYMVEYDEYGFAHSPISDLIYSYFFGDITAKKVFSQILCVLSNYDMIIYNRETEKYKTYLDRKIVTKLNKIKKLISFN